VSERSPHFGGFRAASLAPETPYPRVLIVGHNFDLLTGGGITLNNLFREWPREQLAVADFHPCEIDPAPCGRQYLLGSNEKRWVWPIGLAAPRGQPSVPDLEFSVPLVSKTKNAVLETSAVGIRSVAIRAGRAGVSWLGGVDVLRSLACSESLLQWVRDVRPDLIYTLLGDLGMTRLVTQLSDCLALPIAPHIMDDWPSVIYDRGLLGPHLRAETDRLFRKLVARAPATLAISQRMADVYHARYGREWEVFHNPVDISKWASVRRQDWSRQGAFKLIYAGRVGRGIEASLVDMCLAVGALKRRGLDLQLDIFTPCESAAETLQLATLEGVKVHDAIDDKDMPRTLAAADLLVLPYDFFGKAAEFACLSYPTKAPAYMATGVPTLVYAPRGHALTMDAREKGWACVVDSPGADGLVTAIRKLANDAVLREELAKRAVATCESLYDARVVRERFRAALARVSESDGPPGPNRFVM